MRGEACRASPGSRFGSGPRVRWVSPALLTQGRRLAGIAGVRRLWSSWGLAASLEVGVRGETWERRCCWHRAGARQVPRHCARCFPSLKTLSSSPRTNPALCPGPSSPRFGSKVGQGGFTGLSPTVVLGGDRRKVYKPLIAQGWLRLQQPCAPHVGDTSGTPARGPCPPQTGGAEPPATGIVLPSAGDKSVPPGQIRLRPTAAGGREHPCSICAVWRLWLLLSEGPRHHWHSLKHWQGL